VEGILVRFSTYFLRLFLALGFVAGCTAVSGQTAPINHNRVSPVYPEDILKQLAPDDVPPRSLALKPAEKARAIRLLVAVKRDETEWRKQMAICLLAMLGYDYERNRDELLKVWRRNGDDGTMAQLIRLYEQGHKELLQPLLARYDGWNASTSEGLGAINWRKILRIFSQFWRRSHLEGNYIYAQWLARQTVVV